MVYFDVLTFILPMQQSYNTILNGPSDRSRNRDRNNVKKMLQEYPG